MSVTPLPSCYLEDYCAMPLFAFHKLVRDRVPEQMTADGCTFVLRELTGQQLIDALKIKAAEEYKEIEQVLPRHEELSEETKKELIKELADLKEVIEAWMNQKEAVLEETLWYQQKINELRHTYQIDMRVLLEEQQKKVEKKGAFKKGYFIEDAQVPEDCPQYDYIKKNYPLK